MRIPFLAVPAAALTVHGWAADEPAAMKHGVKLFTDRDRVIDEMPNAVRDRPSLRTSIKALDEKGKIRATSLSITGDRTKLPVERENCFHLTAGVPACPGVCETSAANDK